MKAGHDFQKSEELFILFFTTPNVSEKHFSSPHQISGKVSESDVRIC